MSIDTISTPPAIPQDPVFRLSVDQYHAMIETGVLTDDDPVELLEGFLIYKMSKNPKHRIGLAKLERAFHSLLPASMSIQLQEPITLMDSEPEPDLTIFHGQPEDYPTRHPGAEEVPLVVEVGDSTLSRDRGIKLRTYARAGIAIYWIVDLIARTVTVHSKPDPTATPPVYLSSKPYDENASVPVELDGRIVGQIKVADILP